MNVVLNIIAILALIAGTFIFGGLFDLWGVVGWWGLCLALFLVYKLVDNSNKQTKALERMARDGGRSQRRPYKQTPGGRRGGDRSA